MHGVSKWWLGLSDRARASFGYSFAIVGFISTIMSVLGLTLKDFVPNLRTGCVIIAAVYGIAWLIAFLIIERLYRDSVSLVVRCTPVTVKVGDIFSAEGLRVIGCDNCFDTRADDSVIAMRSLQGQLVLEHGSAEEICAVVEAEARRRGVEKHEDGRYHFPIGAVVRYDSSIDSHTYLLVAVSELNERYEAHTNMAQFEQMLMRMWREIDTVYALNSVALPLLGAGMMRFDDGPKGRDALLRCLLCTLNASGVTLKSDVTVMLGRSAEGIALFEYRDMFHTFSGVEE